MAIGNIDIKRPTKEEVDFEFVVFYKDGTTLRQEYDTPNEKNFGDIDQDRLEKFVLTDGKREYSLDINTGKFNLNGMVIRFSFPGHDEEELDRRLVYFRRVRQDFGPDARPISVRSCFGYQVTIDGKNHQRLIFIEEDGSVTISTKK